VALKVVVLRWRDSSVKEDGKRQAPIDWSLFSLAGMIRLKGPRKHLFRPTWNTLSNSDKSFINVYYYANLLQKHNFCNDSSIIYVLLFMVDDDQNLVNGPDIQPVSHRSPVLFYDH
jgi:hypothetical protein